MIIKKIQIENYLCYYGLNSCQFEDGLNIVLGENNEGKTKFFEAIDWLFTGQNEDLGTLASAKKIKEISPGDGFRVSVSMIVHQFDSEFKITRSFAVQKQSENKIETSNLIFEGEETDFNTGQREPKNAQILLNRVFPHQIRRYSMFKGETQLNIFENDEALSNLINLFSEARHFDKYTEKISFLREKAEKAVDTSTKQNQKNQREYQNLERDIQILQKEKKEKLIFRDSTEEEISNLEKNISEAEKYVDNAKDLKIINERIQKTKEKISSLNSIIDENFTQSLFDESWILVNFEPFQKEFSKKITTHSQERRKLQSEFDRLKGIKEGEKKAKEELLNNAVPLPIGVPSKDHMEEMLKDKVCKVCNTPAPKGSKPYKFMAERLKDYLSSQDITTDNSETQEDLFKYDYTNRLDNLKISHEDNLKNYRLIKSKIGEHFEFNYKRKKEIEKYENQLNKEKTERERILGNSKIGDEETLIGVFKNYTSWQSDLNSAKKDQIEIQGALADISEKLNAKEEEKNKIDLDSASSFLINTRNILRDIETIIIETKNRKFDEFIISLETKSNKFLNNINVEAFTGQIKFTKRKLGETKFKIDVSLIEEGGRYFVPGTAVRTSMNISILLAISELAHEVRDETYPMIFDAPTSSFGETKTGDFLNLIYKTTNQKIIFLKDFIGSIRNPDGTVKDLYIKGEFNSIQREKAFWVKLERPFNKKDLSTLNTEIIPL
ncbi:AAA family ATPase [Cryomorphaceae bacterium 1068]|nr:AAA family ATPase [Cryomorphaceae bacterium 1068]